MQVRDWKSIAKLGDLQVAAEKSIWEMMSLTKESLHQEPYTKDEIVQILGLKSLQKKERKKEMIQLKLRLVFIQR